MIKCKDCVYLNENGCTKNPSELQNPVCLLRHIAIILTAVAEEYLSDSDEDNWWKGNSEG